MSKKYHQFKCIHCGDMFSLNDDEQIAYEEGWFSFIPDTCNDCCDMINHPSHDISDLHSDADPGL